MNIMECPKCQFPNGIIIKPDGVNELDPCIYEVEHRYTNCIVEICKCRKCGYIDVSWIKTEDTEDIADC